MSLLLENASTDIFTDYDESIFSDGSIDPLGLRMIWTSLGNKIFGNRLNTISTDIRLYTLNLFHHAVISELQEIREVKIVNLIGRPPYHNRTDLYDGLVIFLECVLAHILTQESIAHPDEHVMTIPGGVKLRNTLINRPNDRMVTELPVDRTSGILIRHILLGIHGRHKGPFQQMALFEANNYYADTMLWKEVRGLFQKGVWGRLFNALVLMLDRHVLSAKVRGEKPIRLMVKDVINDSLSSLYMEALQPENFRKPIFIHFWEKRLGLSESNTTAGIIYQFIKAHGSQSEHEPAFRTLLQTHQNEDLEAINTIEPFITCIQKIMDKLLNRGITEVDDALEGFVRIHLESKTIDIDRVRSFIREEFFNQEARKRLNALVDIYQSCTSPVQTKQFISKLIDFHKVIMKQRNNLPWISISQTHAITQHRSFYNSTTRLEFLENSNWVNDYYFGTVASLHAGLHQST